MSEDKKDVKDELIDVLYERAENNAETVEVYYRALGILATAVRTLATANGIEPDSHAKIVCGAIKAAEELIKKGGK